MTEKYTEGIGRRKTSSARVRLFKGSGQSTINGKTPEEYFPSLDDVGNINEPLSIAGLDKGYYFTVQVEGGGITGQKGAIILGLSRALVELDETNKPDLRKRGFMTRDPRMVERKKYSRKKARKKPQFSKR